MNELQLTIFIDEENMEKMSEGEYEGETSDLTLYLEVEEFPIHVDYCHEDGIETITLYDRNGVGIYEHPLLSVDIESVDDFDEFPDEMYDIMVSLYLTCRNMNIILTKENLVEEYKADQELQKHGGLIARVNGGVLETALVFGKNRPYLTCISPDGELCKIRPYEDEFNEHMNILFDDIEVKIQRANEGSERDIRDLTYRYLFGLEEEPDYIKAMEWAQKAIEHDDTFGYFAAAVMYCKGWGVERDYNQAWEYLFEHPGVDQYCDGLAEAMGDIADYYEEIEYDKYALEAYAQQVLDLDIYLSRIGLQFECQELSRCATRLEHQGNLSSYFYYARAEELSGAPLETVVELYKKGDKAGDYNSSIRLAFLYFDGLGVRKSKKRGINLLKKAVDMGSSDACRLLGERYYYDEEDDDQALYYFQKYLEVEEDEEIQDIVDEIMEDKNIYHRNLN